MISVAARVIGRGDPVVLLHGSLLSNPWSGFENRLAGSFTVYLPEMPGFGASNIVPGRRHDPELFAEALCDFLRERRLTDAPIVAMSFGSITALKAARRGCATGKLILVGLPGRMNEPVKLMGSLPTRLKRLLASSQWFRRRFILPTLREAVGTGMESVAVYDAKTLKRMRTTTARAIADTDYADEINNKLRTYLRNVPNEQIFIYGELDTQRAAAYLWRIGYAACSGGRYCAGSGSDSRSRT